MMASAESASYRQYDLRRSADRNDISQLTCSPSIDLPERADALIRQLQPLGEVPLDHVDGHVSLDPLVRRHPR